MRNRKRILRKGIQIRLSQKSHQTGRRNHIDTLPYGY